MTVDQTPRIVVHCGDVLEDRHDGICPHCGEWVNPAVRHMDATVFSE